jgi:Lrp/AsnC family leucine-responsive transcriptional regulator
MIKEYQNIDKTDKNILNSLVKNCRKNYAKIAKELNLSKEVARYRIKRLEQRGIIKAYKTLIDFSFIDCQIYELLIRLKKYDRHQEKEFIEFLKKSDVLGFGDCMGEFDFNIILAVENLMVLDDFINELKRILENNLESIDVLVNMKENYVYHNENRDFKKQEINEKEKKLLKLLINNSTISLKEISKNLNLSYLTIVDSLRKMKKSGIIKAFYPDIAFREIELREYSVFIKMKSLSSEQEEKFVRYLVKNDYVWWYVRYIGKYDYGVEFIVPHLKELKIQLEELCDKFKDTIIETKTVRYVTNKK